MTFAAVAFADRGNRCYWQGGRTPPWALAAIGGRRQREPWCSSRSATRFSRGAASHLCAAFRARADRQFDITNPQGIRPAYEIGLKDGEAFAVAMAARSA
jgi:hypothetical protein